MEERRKSRLEGLIMARFFKHLPSVVRYPVVAVLIGALITGTGNFTIKSYGLLLVAIWLAIDLWAWLLNPSKKFRLYWWVHKWRFVIGWAGTSILLICVMALMFVFLNGILADERTESLDKLTIDYSIPSSEIGSHAAVVTVVNGSSYDISGRHRLICQVHVERFAGSGGLDNLEFMQRPDEGWVMGAHWDTLPIADTGIVIHGKGDAESTSCLSVLHFTNTPIKCADITYIFQYFLADEPQYRQEKKTRIVTYPDAAGNFKWYRESLDRRDSRCSKE